MSKLIKNDEKIESRGSAELLEKMFSKPFPTKSGIPRYKCSDPGMCNLILEGKEKIWQKVLASKQFFRIENPYDYLIRKDDHVVHQYTKDRTYKFYLIARSGTTLELKCMFSIAKDVYFPEPFLPPGFAIDRIDNDEFLDLPCQVPPKLQPLLIPPMDRIKDCLRRISQKNLVHSIELQQAVENLKIVFDKIYENDDLNKRSVRWTRIGINFDASILNEHNKIWKKQFFGVFDSRVKSEDGDERLKGAMNNDVLQIVFNYI